MGDDPGSGFCALAYRRECRVRFFTITHGFYLFGGSSHRREKAIKDLLARSGHKLDNWTALGLAGTLKLPMPWIDEAKVSIPPPPAQIVDLFI